MSPSLACEPPPLRGAAAASLVPGELTGAEGVAAVEGGRKGVLTPSISNLRSANPHQLMRCRSAASFARIPSMAAIRSQ